jgi:hypothetical protein
MAASFLLRIPRTATDDSADRESPPGCYVHRRDFVRWSEREEPRAAKLAAYVRAVVGNATYAVMVEPRSGSLNGKPRRPPVFVGKLMPIWP